MDWIKLYTQKWIWGSGRMMTPEKRGIWVDLLALAAESKFRDGTLRFEVGQPMPMRWIASTLMIDEDMLKAALEAFKADVNADDKLPRIQVWDDGTIQITNWDKYQGKPEKVKAKEAAIEEGRKTRRSTVNAINAMNRNINENTRALKSTIKELNNIKGDEDAE